MLQSVFKCKEEMGYSGDCSKPKKTKTTDHYYSPNWEYLPTLILEEIFCYLDENDRINASCTCHSWRQLYFRPKFHKVIKFDIQTHKIDEARFKICKFGHMVTHASIQFDSLSPQCVLEFMNLIERFEFNKNLVSINIEPSHSNILIPNQYIHNSINSSETPLLDDFLNICSGRSMECLNLGLNEELTSNMAEFLHLLQQTKPERVKQLGLASIKDDPGNYLISNCDPSLFKPFTSLQVLSIDYDILNDSLLTSLQAASDLQRLVIHVHGIWEGHPGTTENAWKDFKQQHPRCLLRVSLIHAYDEVLRLEDHILKKNMPLSHLKVLFCENINLRTLDILTRYHETFRSLVWVDSQCHDEQSNSWNIIRRYDETYAPTPDPIVMIAWRCRLLEEIVLIGYKYFEDDLIAIARLRSDNFRRLEIPFEEVLTNDEKPFHNAINEISKLLGKGWSPVPITDLHPVILDPTAGDSDEYLMPILLADLH